MKQTKEENDTTILHVVLVIVTGLAVLYSFWVITRQGN
jgi:hypothetical protein